jgi:hypothetical protein
LMTWYQIRKGIKKYLILNIKTLYWIKCRHTIKQSTGRLNWPGY